MSDATKTILVVDDSALSRATVEAMLVARGYAVKTATDGEGALTQIPLVKPDLILIDVVMPQMNGWETCQRIREIPESAAVPIVVVTSKNTPHDMLQAFEVGANEFINKPIDADELYSVIERLLKKGESSSPPVEQA